MNITIVGTGNIGGGLARAWHKAGHAVTLAVRDPEAAEVVALAQETAATVRPLAQGIRDAQVIALAVPFDAVDAVAAALDDWAGRVVIDCTNAIAAGPSLQYGHDDSAAEVNARRLQGARVVKSFNAQGAENLARPVYDGIAAVNFYCGDYAEAKDVVRGLIRDVGFEPVDLGPLTAARFLEPLTLVWFAAARALGTREVGFHLLRR